MNANTILTEEQISEWLAKVNKLLVDVGRKPIRKDFTEILYKEFYTKGQSEIAQKFIVWGKRIDFRTDEVLPNYFFPTLDDMEQFKNEFITTKTHEAKLSELQRRYDAKEELQASAFRQKSKQYEEAKAEIARLKFNPATAEPVRFDFDTRKLIDDTLTILDSGYPQMLAEHTSMKKELRTLKQREAQNSNAIFDWVSKNVEQMKQIVELKQKLMQFDSQITLSDDEKLFIEQQKDVRNRLSCKKNVVSGEIQPLSAVLAKKYG